MTARARESAATPSSDSKARVSRGLQFPLVQSLRGIAAMWVVLFHAEEGGHISQLAAAMPGWLADVLFHWGQFGVPIFFALSGFVIAHSLRGLVLSWRTLGRFALRRSIRLDPPYWASIIFVIAMGYVSARVKHQPFTPPDASTVLAHLAYLQVLLSKPEINVVYWTLTYEVQFYLFYASVLVIAARLVRWQTVLWGIMFALALASAVGAFNSLKFGVFLTLWAAFFAGVLAYQGIEHRWARAGFVVLLVAMIARLDPFMLASAATAAILLAASLTGVAQRRPLSPVGQWVGMISYSLYLIHNPITGATGYLAHKLLGVSVLGDALTLLVIIAACLIGAYAFWWLFERPSHGFSKRISMR